MVASTWLEGYQLRFRGGNYSSVATVEPSEDDLVPVLVWEIQPDDENSLDIYEGWPHLYRKETLKIKLGKKILPAMIYIMNGEKYPYGYPSQLYFDTIRDGPYGYPSQLYFDTIRDGYISAGFDPKLLHQAVAENMKGERLYG